MDLRDQPFILVDFQTTGTKADESYILEAGWGLYRASEEAEHACWYNHLILLPEGERPSSRIQKMTGLDGQGGGSAAISYEELGEKICAFLDSHPDLPVLIHFARFKLPFLERVLLDRGRSVEELATRVVCSYQLSKSLLPQLKSYTLRAIAGYANYSLGDKKRTREHLLATASVWRYLAPAIEIPEAIELKALPATLAQYRATQSLDAGVAEKKLSLHSTELRAKRLALPLEPGIYYFLDRSQRILYVGKARQLKARVNSYFRGRKTKGSRLNELLTRTADLRVLVCGTELEALLQESDAIKQHKPPYNILLTEESRGVHWLSLKTWLKNHKGILGPFSSLWYVRALETFIEERSIPGSRGAQLGRLIGRPPIPDAWLDAALSHWLSAYGLVEPENGQEGRAMALFHLAKYLGHDYRARVRERTYAPQTLEEVQKSGESNAASVLSEEEEQPELDEPKELEPHDIVELLEDTLGRLSYQLFRARWLLRLLDAEIWWTPKDPEARSFRVSSQAGVIRIFSEEPAGPGVAAAAWNERSAPMPLNERRELVKLAVYDRMIILYSSLKRGLQKGDAIRLSLGPHTLFDESSLRLHIF